MIKPIELLCFVVIAFFICNLKAQNITTIAGGGPVNLQALQTGLPDISGLAVDSVGNVYVSVGTLNQIWKVDTAGKVNVFAGNGSSGNFGDGGQALNASFSQPSGLVFDTAGNLYVADSGYGRVRKIAANGVITTVAGGVYSYPGIGDGGPATSAYLSYPVALAIDASNNLYVAERYGSRVRIVSSTGTINTLAGNGISNFSGDDGPATSASLSYPNSVAVDSAGTVYISDSNNYRVRKVVAGVISTFAGTGVYGDAGDGGPATLAKFSSLAGVVVDRFGDVFIAEGSSVREVAAGQSNVVTFAGSPDQGYGGDGNSPTSATFSYLTAIAVDSALNVYIGDQGNSRVRKATASLISTIAGNGTLYNNGQGQLATSARLNTISNIAVDNAGTLVFPQANSIQKIALNTSILSTFAGTGTYGYTPDGGLLSGPLINAYSVAFDLSGTLYFSDQNRLRKAVDGVYQTVANASGIYGFSGDGGLAISASFSSIYGIAVASNGDIFIADEYNHRIRAIKKQTGVITTVAGTGVSGFSGDGGPATGAQLYYPSQLALDGSGNLFIVDSLGSRIRKLVLATNVITTVAGNGGFTGFADGVLATTIGLSGVSSIFADQSGNLFLSDNGNSRIRKVTASTGLISTVAGNGSRYFGGDGGPALAAGIDPRAITIDQSQSLYIADSSGRIRKTTVSACFFTLSTPSFAVTKTGGTGSVTITGTNADCPYTLFSSSPFVTITGNASGTGSGTVTFAVAANTGNTRSATVNVGGASFTVAQTGTPAQYNVGYFQASGPTWALDATGNGTFDVGDKFFSFAGQPGAIAVVGDWNGDGRSKIGYFLNGFWALDYDGNGIFDSNDKFYAYGGPDPSYVPVVGDWNGDGRTKIGFYKSGFWLLDTNGNGAYDAGDKFFAFGGNGAGEIPLVGDWNGDLRTKVGYFYHGSWVLDYNGDGLFTGADKWYTNFTYISTDKPVVGDWNGDGRAKIGIYRLGFWILDANGNGTFDGVQGGDKFYAFGGNPGEMPIVADWNGDGRSKVGVFLNGFWTLDFNGNGTYDLGDRSLSFGGETGFQPIIGRW